MPLKDPVRSRAAIETQIQRIAWLRGTGPNPLDYTLWDERTEQLLRDIYGEESPEVERYHEASGIRGRLPGVRGQAENMTLNIHGPWGILSRLEQSVASSRAWPPLWANGCGYGWPIRSSIQGTIMSMRRSRGSASSRPVFPTGFR